MWGLGWSWDSLELPIAAGLKSEVAEKAWSFVSAAPHRGRHGGFSHLDTP